MKTLCLLALLLAPVVGFGETGLFEKAPIGNIAPVKTYRAEADIGKGLGLAFSTLFYPERVKDEWPVYGYRIEELCSDQSLRDEKFTVKEAALARQRRDRPETAAAYIGIPLSLSGEDAITTSIEAVCIEIEMHDLVRKVGTYDAIDLPEGKWEKIVEQYSNDSFLEQAIPLLSGTSTTNDVSERGYSTVWRFADISNIPDFKVAWRGYDPNSGENLESWDVIRKYVPKAGDPHQYGYYLAKAKGNSQDGGGSRYDEDEIRIWSPWAGEFRAQGKQDFTLDSNYSIWYLPSDDSQQFVQQQFPDDWYLVTDEPLPHARADIRFDPFK